eukprot:CAMPEP_0206490948 /NCGR_PEP_ID=MMETSP0324_2-20121206/44513_1 /ASSEMBLY_ACC=CAM_ASM_000836 /TAXON_ID=2866 /ORGANISM="Crypthecodinium cohnii, Strain Seligo" /LENGTH=76 /DNA_ID=CAMNT_0053971663 /DNA_START=599 /DNA_END=829 /DNA_ORIENTATION=-
MSPKRSSAAAGTWGRSLGGKLCRGDPRPSCDSSSPAIRMSSRGGSRVHNGSSPKPMFWGQVAGFRAFGDDGRRLPP